PSPRRGAVVDALVEACRSAAVAVGAPAPSAPWLPPLPARVLADELAAWADPQAARGGLPIALVDLPSERRQLPLRWVPSSGHLLVVGAPGSGRSTTLRTAAVAALGLGWHVHAVGLPADLTHDLLPHVGMGTVLGLDEPRALARLIELLGAEPDARSDRDAPRRLLLLDGLDAVAEPLGSMARGAGLGRLLDLLRTGRSHGVAVAASAGPAMGAGARCAAHLPARLVLPVGDRGAEAIAGVPAGLTGVGRPPGRAVWLPPPAAAAEPAACEAALCQVALALAPAVVHGPSAHGSAPAGRTQERPGRATRLLPLPTRVGRSEMTAARAIAPPGVGGRAAAPRRSPDEVVVGLGGDTAELVRLDVRRGALVVGPPGSGRSTALAVLAEELLAAGRPVAILARDGPLRRLGDARVPQSTCGFAVGRAMELLSRTAPGTVVLVDDLDALEQLAPTVADRLTSLVTTLDLASAAADAHDGADRATGPLTVVVGAAQTVRAATAFRGTVAALRGVRSGIVLSPGEPGSDDVFGSALAWHVDPVRPRAPGRGVRQHGSDLVPVQLLDPTGPDDAGPRPGR
ncbi:hypothetical protein HIR71_02780, partial [Cellulomonas fimi]|nr:hypothetical protein [Cellulomonas fimi]